MGSSTRRYSNGFLRILECLCRCIYKGLFNFIKRLLLYWSPRRQDVFLQKIADKLRYCSCIWEEYPDVIDHCPDLLKFMVTGRCRHFNNSFHLVRLRTHTLLAEPVPQEDEDRYLPDTLLQIQLR